MSMNVSQRPWPTSPAVRPARVAATAAAPASEPQRPVAPQAASAPSAPGVLQMLTFAVRSLIDWLKATFQALLAPKPAPTTPPAGGQPTTPTMPTTGGIEGMTAVPAAQAGLSQASGRLTAKITWDPNMAGRDLIEFRGPDGKRVAFVNLKSEVNPTTQQRAPLPQLFAVNPENGMNGGGGGFVDGWTPGSQHEISVAWDAQRVRLLIDGQEIMSGTREFARFNVGADAKLYTGNGPNGLQAVLAG